MSDEQEKFPRKLVSNDLREFSKQPLSAYHDTLLGAKMIANSSTEQPVDVFLLDRSIAIRQVEAQERIAAAMEQANDLLAGKYLPKIDWEAVGPFGHQLLLQLEADNRTVTMKLECPEGDEVGAQGILQVLRLALEPLFVQEEHGGPQV